MGLSTDGKPITPWQGSWAQQENERKSGHRYYSPLHGQTVTQRSDRPDLLLPKRS